MDGTEDSCKSSSGQKKGSESRTCRKDDLKNGCEVVEGEIPINYIIFNDKKICLLRKRKTLIDLIKSNEIISKGDNCLDGYRLWGIIERFERQLCIKEDEEELPLLIIFFRWTNNYISRWITNNINHSSELRISFNRLRIEKMDFIL